MKTPLPKFAFLFLLLMPSLGRAQEGWVSGQVIDAATKKPVEFASMSLRNAQTGALTDLEGRFRLSGLSRDKPDSLIVMTLPYERYAMAVNAAKCTDLVVEITQRKGYGSEQVVGFYCGVRPRPYSVIPESEQLRFITDSQYAFFIPNREHKPVGKLRAVSFYLGENGLSSTPFRLRIYKQDGPGQAPGADLLHETVFVKAAENGSWHTVDLSAHSISVAAEGFFIAVEFAVPRTIIPPAALTSNPASGLITSGLIMRPDFDFRKSNTWHFLPATGWSRAPLTSSMRRYNAMVKASVDVID